MTFTILYHVNILLVVIFVLLILMVYITKLVELFLDSFEKDLYWLHRANLFVSDIFANLAFVMPILIVFFNIVALILILT